MDKIGTDEPDRNVKLKPVRSMTMRKAGGRKTQGPSPSRSMLVQESSPFEKAKQSLRQSDVQQPHGPLLTDPADLDMEFETTPFDVPLRSHVSAVNVKEREEFFD